MQGIVDSLKELLSETKCDTKIMPTQKMINVLNVVLLGIFQRIVQKTNEYRYMVWGQFWLKKIKMVLIDQ